MSTDDVKEEGLTNLEEAPEKDRIVPDTARSLKEIGPESEVRGGPEAPSD